MNQETLSRALFSEFGGSQSELRAVSRQARDLSDSGKIREDLGYDLDVDAVRSNLADAPAGSTLTERWNWWMGSLELAYGGYSKFRVNPEIL